jgi:tetratricopeptide (TPR) repeat protein
MFLFIGNGQTRDKKISGTLDVPKRIILQQADSLLKAGKEDMALELYFKSVNMNRPELPRVYPILKKIGNIYLKKKEYQKAIYFFKEYEWMAQLDISFSYDTLPEIDLTDGVIPGNAEMWNLTMDGEFNPLKATVRNTREKELAKFKLQLEELEQKHSK